MKKNVFTISSVFSFADTLALKLLQNADNDPLSLAKTVIFLPTQRACKAIKEAFLRQNNGNPLLLPRLIPFLQIDNEENQAFFSVLFRTPCPPALSNMRRQLLLAKLILKNPVAFGLGDLCAAKALQLAGSLGEFLDQASIENMSFDQLNTLVPDTFALHWQKTLTFLKIITLYWPDILKEENKIDLADRRVRMFLAQIKIWQTTPPDYTIIGAGSTGDQPATALLLDAIASLPNGRVILPGLDRFIDQEEHALNDPNHPQYALLNLLKTMNVAVKDVPEFADVLLNEVQQARLRLVSEIMRPAQTTSDWQKMMPIPNQALDGLTLIEAQNAQQESLSIALILRKTLETPEKTAVLVTPDRALASRVISEMKRWGITLDDSAGLPLSATPLGIFLILTAKMVLCNFDPIETLACLKHPLATNGQEMGVFRKSVRAFEIKLRSSLGKKSEFLTHIQEKMSDFIDLANAGRDCSLTDLIKAHLKACEALACSADRSGGQRLWAGTAGEQAVDFFNQLIENADLIDQLMPSEYVSFLTSLMAGISVREKYGSHPRLDILGTIEARLVQADVVILGGLNEGVFPQTIEADPWLSRPMRKMCGLPDLERKIGLTAHDFVSNFCGKEVYLTRSLKNAGTPTVPSRWLLRLETVLSVLGLRLPVSDFVSFATRLDMPTCFIEIPPTEPCPPVEARPKRLAVTKIETLMRDPYAIYARYILNLRPLNELNKDLTVADFGSLLHDVLKTFCTKYGNQIPINADIEIKEIAQYLLDQINATPKTKAFWFARLSKSLDWFIDQQTQRINQVTSTFTEIKGETNIKTYLGNTFTLFGTADRIDVNTDGSATIIDYKTGTPPKNNTVEKGFAPQLPLEANLVLDGGFNDISNVAHINALEYWQMGSSTLKIHTLKADPLVLVELYKTNLTEIISAYENPDLPYRATPDTSVQALYRDYDHLARFKEWSSTFTDTQTDEDEEEDG